LQRALPDIRVGIGVVHHPPPHAECVEIFLPIPSRFQRSVGIAAAIARNAGAAAAFERERFHEFRAVAAAKTERAAISGAGLRIAPDQQALRARPDAMDDSVAAVFLK
jgi:hypothetical protein